MRLLHVTALLAAGSVAVAAASFAASPSTVVYRGTDTRLCGFPLGVTVRSAGPVDPAAPTVGHVTLAGPVTVTLRNHATGAATRLRSGGTYTVDTRTGTVSFRGGRVWFWSSGARVPFVRTLGRGTFDGGTGALDAPHVSARVLDPCWLVGPRSPSGPLPHPPPPANPAATRAPWPVPGYALSHIGYAGLVPLLGRVIRHDHVHLDVIVNGRKVKVPGGIGLAEPVDGGPCPQGPQSSGDCATDETIFARVAVSPLHTHASSGLVHIESDRGDPYTLGQVFDEWGVRLDRRCLGGYCTGGGKELRVYVNGRRVPGDPRAVELRERQEIAVVFGDDFDSVPSRYSGRWPGPGCGGPGEESCVPSRP